MGAKRTKMKFTNKHNLPVEVFDVLSKDNYTAGNTDFSATTLLKTPRQVQLQRRHNDEMTEDVIDRVWSLLGQAAHSVLEKHGSDTSLTEERLYAEVFGRRISGQVDHYHAGCITDYKVTSVYTIIYGSRIHEWTEQLNIYGWLFRQNKFDVNKLQIVAILRDWSATEAARKSGYPQSPITIIPLTLWSMPSAEAYINMRVAEHKNAEALADAELPNCTKEEMWETDSKYAVMKEGRKSAIRVYDSKEEAEQHITDIQTKANDVSLQIRSGERRKCVSYCSCKEFCNQWLEYTNDSD